LFVLPPVVHLHFYLLGEFDPRNGFLHALFYYLPDPMNLLFLFPSFAPLFCDFLFGGLIQSCVPFSNLCDQLGAKRKKKKSPKFVCRHAVLDLLLGHRRISRCGRPLLSISVPLFSCHRYGLPVASNFQPEFSFFSSTGAGVNPWIHGSESSVTSRAGRCPSPSPVATDEAW
jgi:hypothetical protein